MNPISLLGWSLRRVWVSSRELADLRGKVAAVSRAQPMIEFDMDGTVINANENFLKASGYSLGEIRGKHHRMFVDAESRDTPEYKAFWERLRRGEHQNAQYKRMAKNGRPVWVEATYYPIATGRGKPFKVVKYTNDITERMLTEADGAGQLVAISKAQAVMEFELNGTVRTANDNFLRMMGYSLEDVRGKHHSMFVDPASRETAEYRALWAKLARGEYDASQYKRVARGGREVWIQGSYNPIMDAGGKPFKVVEYATDITERVKFAEQLRSAVAETQAAVTAAAEGDLTRRISMEGKTGELATLSQGVNSLIDVVMSLVKQIK
ncbi:MAG TPA: PAS domain-containing protein, partial [Steroidobacteraceae bacterium]|nr:PAS domain-containing protein [Steroidobacteraceae bacterium]